LRDLEGARYIEDLDLLRGRTSFSHGLDSGVTQPAGDERVEPGNDYGNAKSRRITQRRRW